MKAVAVFPQSKELKLIEHDEPQIARPDQVKLRVLDVGVCGTDRHICEFAFGFPPNDDQYLILGHEALAEVVAVGSGVHTLKPGDLVVPEVRHPCLHADCRACRAGQQNFCYTMDYVERGIQGIHGYMTDIVVDDEQYLHGVPAALRDVAVLVEPLTIAEKAFAQALHIQQRLPWLTSNATSEQPGRGLRAVVLGAGPIGLLGAMLLVTAGFETYVYSRSRVPNAKAEVAEAIGARYVSTETTPVEQFAARVGAIDLVYEALDATPTAGQILPLIGPNSIYVFTSQPSPRHPMGSDVAEALQHIIMHNNVIVGTVNAGRDAFLAAIRHLAIFQQRWPHALRSLITARYPIENYAEVLLAKPDGIKHVIAINT